MIHYTIRPHRDEEHRLQSACVRYFDLKYSHLRGLLFAVPNGGRRDPVTGARLKAEGVVAGVADLLLLIPRGDKHGMCIEMKTKKGRQSPAQKEWHAKVEAFGYDYQVCRTFEDFVQIIENYLNK